MNTYIITKEDIKNRIYFIAKLAQKQTSSTMQGALTSKSDFIGGIFDRFINTLSDTLVFNKIIFQKPPFTSLNKEIKAIDDFYYYNPKKSGAGIAPDILGIVVDNIPYPFIQFDNKWKAIPGMPQIEIKTFKAKDQMISLRNQNYDDKYLIFVDLNMRIDYLIPFLDQTCLDSNLMKTMKMNDSIFLIKDDNHLISQVSEIDFSDTQIGTMTLLSITSANSFMKQATFCEPNISICRVKEIRERGTKVVNHLLHDALLTYVTSSTRISSLYEFKQTLFSKIGIPSNTKILDFSSNKIEYIEINKYNNQGIVISASQNGCTFNGTDLIVGKQYTVKFDILDRSSNKGSEYFMQKQCACYLTQSESQLINEIMNIIQ